MSYSIRYHHGPGSGESQHWTQSLLEAKLHAKEVVTSGSAETAEVRDAEGKLVYKFPEEVAASG